MDFFAFFLVPESIKKRILAYNNRPINVKNKHLSPILNSENAPSIELLKTGILFVFLNKDQQ